MSGKDPIFLGISVFGVLMAFFMMGSISTYFKHFPYGWLMHAVSAKNAMDEQSELLSNAIQPVKDPNELLAEVTVHSPDAYAGQTAFSDEHFSGVILVDMQGSKVFSWSVPHEPGLYVRDFHLYPNGDALLSMENYTVTPYGVGLVKLDKDSKVLWTYKAHVNHLVSVTSDGRIVGIAHELVKNKKLSGLLQRTNLLEDFLFVLDKDGHELLNISLTDALVHSEYVDMVRHADLGVVAKKHRWDLTHTNSAVMLEPSMANAFPMFSPGQVLVSLRNINMIGVVDLQEKTFVWAEQGDWRGQHDAQFMADGRIVLFDNNGLDVGVSRIVAVNPANGDMSTLYASTPEHPLSSQAFGSQQILPNNDILITESHGQRVLEVTPNQETVWELRVKMAEMMQGVYTAKRYAPDYFTFQP